MSLNLQNKYPGRFDPVSADYPQGKFKNRSSPTAQDGSYMERDWLNDWSGFFGAILKAAGVAPDGVVDTAQSSQMFDALKTVIYKAHYLTQGAPLPTANIGPIWHDDYASWMTWQEFTANSANYRGYASQNIGSLLLDTQPTPRAGYIKSGVQNLSRVTYAALRAWSQHNGLMVAPGIWSAGTIQCADNADGTTFRIYDVRGEFMRALDDNRGVDAGRAFGSAQGDTMRNITGTLSGVKSDTGLGTFYGTGAFAPDGISDTNRTLWGSQQPYSMGTLVGGSFDASRVVPTASENRSRNTAVLAAIKF